jgi:hypothetical protein
MGLLLPFTPPALVAQIPVSNQERPLFAYNEESLRQARIRNQYGRYISFEGTSMETLSPLLLEQMSCRAAVCRPLPRGIAFRTYRYLLDCRDKTVARDQGRWFSAKQDPTARTVMNKFCSRINSLPITLQVRR